jgi:UDP-glucose 4-epimerase
VSVLVTGGCGFIGQYVVRALQEKDTGVIVFDRNADPARDTSLVRHIKGEFGNKGELEAVFGGYKVDKVIHLVSSTLPKSSNDDPVFDVQSNVCETIALLQLCVAYSVGKVVFMSSGGTVYGHPLYSPIDESHPTEPICSYGITKLTIEKYLALFHRLYGLPYVAIRASNPYGPGQSPFGTQGVIPVFLYKMMHGEAIEVWGDGRAVRDFLHVADLARLCCLALESSQCGVANGGSGIGTSINELIDVLSGCLKFSPSVARHSGRLFDAKEIVLSNQRARDWFSWSPCIPFYKGIDELRRYLSNLPLV